MSRLLVPFADQHVGIPALTAGNIALTVGLKQVGAAHHTAYLLCFQSYYFQTLTYCFQVVQDL